MIRRLAIDAPRRHGVTLDRPLRLLAVSDEPERALAEERNRSALEPIDAVLGCGDLEPDYLAFVADAFCVPLLYVRGNHDWGAAWDASHQAPLPLDGRFERVGGLTIAGLAWPTAIRGRAERDESDAWLQAVGVAGRSLLRRQRPQIIISHAPPQGAGDAADAYHRGFAGYRWLCRRLRPMLWLHGHTTVASSRHWRTTLGPTELVNTTGAVMIEIRPPLEAGVPSPDPTANAQQSATTGEASE
jgi:uncharacterized protein